MRSNYKYLQTFEKNSFSDSYLPFLVSLSIQVATYFITKTALKITLL